MTYCKVSDDIARYEAQMDEDEAYYERFSEKKEELLNGEFNPYLIGNISEALSENMTNSELQSAIFKNDFKTIGELIIEISEKYWDKLAEKEAEVIIDKEDNYED